jgi:hypothetical protein
MIPNDRETPWRLNHITAGLIAVESVTAMKITNITLLNLNNMKNDPSRRKVNSVAETTWRVDQTGKLKRAEEFIFICCELI